MRRLPVNIVHGLDAPSAASLLSGLDLGDAAPAVAETLVRLYGVFRSRDAELVEINPLVLTTEGEVLALDCKLVVDDAALGRQHAIADRGTLTRSVAGST